MAHDPLPFDLRSLEIFLAVCDARSMASAARQLGLTQPAVSQAIADMELKTGAVFFDRSVRPIGLTPAGGLLRQRASSLLNEARQIAPMLREMDRRQFPLLQIGLVDSLTRAIAVPLATHLARFADQVSILSGLTSAHASALLTRQMDLLVGADGLEDVEGLDRHELLNEPYILLLPLGAPAPQHVEELQQIAGTTPLVRFSARSRTGMEIDRHLRRLKLDLPRRIEFDTPHGVVRSVAEGHGFAIATPLCLYQAGIEADRVIPAPLPGPTLTRTLTLISRRQELGRLPLELSTFCRGHLADICWAEVRSAIPWLSEAFGPQC